MKKMKALIRKFIPQFLINWYHFGLAFLGAVIYGFPSKKLVVIGVTGTDGKSTTVNLICKVLENAGHKVAVMSSISFKIGDKEIPNKLKMTMPGRFAIQKFLKQAVKEKCKYFILEVSSEGIKQNRHKFINFDIAVFTNLSPEHIESHKGFENYKRTKGKLFKATKGIHVINIDDENSQYFLQFSAKRKYTYGMEKGDINFKNNPFQLKLIGDFNIYNALATMSVGVSQGVDIKIIKAALENAEGIPGRMEMVIKEPFKVIVDYAVTPNALEKVYQILKPQKEKIICVFGACGGGRDKWKRPVLGKIAEKYCDQIILTNEDPYSENPLKILKDIEAGFSQIPSPKSQIPKYEKILDRREAIKKALELAKPSDVVIITGKGCEPWMCIAGGKKIPWDDREIVKEEFNKLTQG